MYSTHKTVKRASSHVFHHLLYTVDIAAAFDSRRPQKQRVNRKQFCSHEDGTKKAFEHIQTIMKMLYYVHFYAEDPSSPRSRVYGQGRFPRVGAEGHRSTRGLGLDRAPDHDHTSQCDSRWWRSKVQFIWHTVVRVCGALATAAAEERFFGGILEHRCRGADASSGACWRQTCSHRRVGAANQWAAKDFARYG